MSKKLWIFNPGHEEALLHISSANYTPPASVRQMMHDLSPIIALLASPEDWVWQPGSPPQLANQLIPILPKRHTSVIYTQAPPKHPDLLSLNPWALEPHILRLVSKQLEGAGYSVLQPTISPEYLYYSHRSSGIELIDYLIEEGTCPHNLRPIWIYPDSNKEQSQKHLLQVLKEHFSSESKLILKRPYSSSGRGVMQLSLPLSSTELSRITNLLHQWGGISLEPQLDLVQDWALEYWSNGEGEIVFEGISCFSTQGTSHSYSGNVLQPQQRLWDMLAQHAGGETQLQRLIDLHSLFLRQHIAKHYTGYIGIDIFAYQTNQGNSLALHPMVEINLRCTMGIMALKTYERLVAPSSHGIFAIKARPTGILFDEDKTISQQHPPIYDKEGRLCQGYLSLTPIQTDTQFAAYLLVEGTVDK